MALERGADMNLKLIILSASLLVLSACMVTARPGGGLTVVPILPQVVELDVNDSYEQGGYFYFYDNERWYYANARDGRRSELPRSHWPRETHRHGHGYGNH
jgi:hypothetical protein